MKTGTSHLTISCLPRNESVAEDFIDPDRYHGSHSRTSHYRAMNVRFRPKSGRSDNPALHRTPDPAVNCRLMRE